MRERLAIAALAIEPILNRVVLAGPPAVTLLLNDPAVNPPALTFAADSCLRFLATSMIDRLGLELQKRGLTRTGRGPLGDRWCVSGEVAVDLVQVRADDGDQEQVWSEYATLLTLPFIVDGKTVVRMAGAPAMLALECAAFAKGSQRVPDSEELERVVLLVAGRPEIEQECAAAPQELRSFIASSLARLAQNDSLHLLIQRALPDSVLLPALAKRVRERMLRIAC